MKTYRVQQLQGTPCWDQIEKAEINCYPWGGDYRPEAFAQLVFVQNQGFLARLCCREENPRAVFEQPDDMVCKDSCLEFFADFDPQKDTGFLNCEANAKGTLHCGIGPARAGRKLLRQTNLPRPQITPFQEGGFWGFEILVPVALLQAAYGRSEFPSGYHFTGNFYKCGDDTAQPHYGVWSPIVWEKPDFHRPEQFGSFVMV